MNSNLNRVLCSVKSFEQRGPAEEGIAVSQQAAPPTVKSADRTIAVLEHLASRGSGQSLNGLHRELGIPKSSLHGLLGTLRQRGWVEVDGSGTLYRLGVRALLVGTAYIDSDDIVGLTRDTLDRLAEETGETVHLARLDGPEVVYLATRQSAHNLRMFSRVGRRLPAHATSLGKALLAQLSPDDLAELLPDPLPALTSHTIIDMVALRAELEVTRQRGYARDVEENTLGISCIGFAVPDGAKPRDAISISVPLVRLDEEGSESLVGILQDAIERLRPVLERRAGR